MAKQLFTVNEASDMLGITAKTFRSRVTKLVPPIAIIDDTKDKRVKHIHIQELRRLAKEYGNSLEDSPKLGAPIVAKSDILTEHEQRIAALEAEIGQMRQLLAGWQSQSHTRRDERSSHSSARVPRVVEEAPEGLMAMHVYSRLHGIPLRTMENAALRGKLHITKEEHRLNGRNVNNWLDADAHAAAFALWQQRDDFTPCPTCPHESDAHAASN